LSAGDVSIIDLVDVLEGHKLLLEVSARKRGAAAHQPELGLLVASLAELAALYFE
jgi:hypothetical protein